jgi:hypothetical protein
LKLNEKEKAFVFRCLSNVLMEGNVLDKCDDQQILLIVNLSTQEMSMSKDVLDENGLANAAKEVLVTLAGKCNKFVNQVINKFLHSLVLNLDNRFIAEQISTRLNQSASSLHHFNIGRNCTEKL